MMAGIIWQQWWFAGKPISLNCRVQMQCRQLGFVWGIPTVSSHFGEVRPPVFSIDEIDCVGDEKHLQDCPHVNHDDCDSGDAAGGHAIYSTLTIISIQQVCFVATSPTLATTGCPKKTHFQNCVGYVWGPNFLVILVILNKHHCSRHFRPLLVFLVILAHLLVNPGLFGYFWLFWFASSCRWDLTTSLVVSPCTYVQSPQAGWQQNAGGSQVMSRENWFYSQSTPRKPLGVSSSIS